jgi:hypothetical protein
MLRMSLHKCLYLYYTILLCVTFVCFSLFGFDPQLLTLRFSWFLYVNIFSTLYWLVDGANRSTQNLAYVAWEIYAPTNKIISLQGVCLGCETNNIA